MMHRWDNKDSSLLDWYTQDTGQLTLPSPTTTLPTQPQGEERSD